MAEYTIQLRAEVRVAPVRRGDPDPDLPRWIVPDMLGMPALELGHPVAVLVLMVSDDRATQSSLGSFP